MGGAASARVTAAHAGARTVAGVARGAIVAADALLLAILNARIRSSRHGRYPERWVGGLSHSWGFQGSSFAFGLQVAQSVVQLGSSSLCAVGGCDGGGRGTTRALHLLAAASTPAWRMVWKPEGLSALAMPGEIEQVAQLLRPGDRARTGRSEELLGVQVWVQAQIRRDALYNRDGAAVATWDAERAKEARAHTSLGPLPQTANETLVVPLVSAPLAAVPAKNGAAGADRPHGARSAAPDTDQVGRRRARHAGPGATSAACSAGGSRAGSFPLHPARRITEQ